MNIPEKSLINSGPKASCLLHKPFESGEQYLPTRSVIEPKKAANKSAASTLYIKKQKLKYQGKTTIKIENLRSENKFVFSLE